MRTADAPTDCNTPFERTDDHFVDRHASFLRRISQSPIDLLFLGDSITRRWAEVANLWNHFFGKYGPANFGIGGDTTQSMLWRLQHGELKGFTPRVTVLLIGTNNVPTNCGNDIATAIQKVLVTIGQSLPKTRTLLLAIFPRGPQTRERSTLNEPYYMDRIIDANLRLSGLRDNPSLRYLDIGSHFLGRDGEIDLKLMPDRLHLVEPGYVVLGESMEPLLEEMMASR